MATQKPSADAGSNKTAIGRSRRRKRRWLRRLTRPLYANKLTAIALSQLAVWYLKLVFKTNSWTVEPQNIVEELKPQVPLIAGVWHGQQVLTPAIPFGFKAAVMISRSFDGDIMTRIAKAFGSSAVRASGGRDAKQTLSKGGLQGLLQMLSTLEAGENVMQTADVSRGVPRKVTMGIITLAKRSGRPIVPFAVASSRRWVLPQSWDRTTINLPFGKAAICVGELVRLSAEADDDEMAAARDKLQSELDRVTARAYELTGRPEQV